MVIALNPGLSWFQPRPGTLCHERSWARQVYKWIPANFLFGVNLRWTSIQPGGKLEILLVALHYKQPEIHAGLMDHLGRMQTLLLPFSVKKKKKTNENVN